MSKKPESRLQLRIRRALEVEFPGSYWWKVHGGPFTPAGIPDLAGVVPDDLVVIPKDQRTGWHEGDWPRIIVGRAVFLEVKRPGEHASRVQRARMTRLRSAGAIVAVVHDVDEAIAAVRSACR